MNIDDFKPIINKVEVKPPETPEEAKKLHDACVEMIAFYQAQIAMIEMEVLPKLRKLMK